MSNDSFKDTEGRIRFPINNRRVLMVDDNPDNLRVLAEALKQEDYELLVALSGEEALELAANAVPDLILLDINMPGLDGFETCRRLKDNPVTRDSVVIFLSGRDSVENKVQGLQLGAVDYISKPFQFEEVLARVGTQLELKRAREELRLMNEKADALLLNILPASIAERLKADERNLVEHFEECTIIFADLVGFTKFAAQLEPDALVALLNRIFTAMDELVEKHGLEKIKTIGDAYMVSSGVPEPRPDHAVAAARFALEVLETIPRIWEAGGNQLGLRIGMHSGPVVAGVIGEKKFAYDLWGDTVNTASRMERNGDPGRIFFGEATRKLLEKDFLCKPTGPRDFKGIGPVETFALTGPR